ncbi:MAG: gamma-glutamylcyclotransferase [Alphaproteobacteria bacterium]|nr:gamma-glutamylcyclotransferase [Alphaproteobacteria bacterium]
MKTDANGDLWVFGYGSLMWNPGFPFITAAPARLRGYHRAFCLYSEHYRGTPERRGLVLGLDRGGSCHGRVFRVGPAAAETTLTYLIEREMFGHPVEVYRLKWLPVALDERSVTAACFVVNRDHPHYAGKLRPERIAEIVRGAMGKSGTNRDYLANTIAHLDELGIRDPRLHRLAKLVTER